MKADVYEIISGHRRYQAATRLEMTEAPVVVLDISNQKKLLSQKAKELKLTNTKYRSC